MGQRSCILPESLKRHSHKAVGWHSRRRAVLQQSSVVDQQRTSVGTLSAVCRPLLPSADKLIPYLRKIDASRVYTNHGELVRELVLRLASEFSVTPDELVICSSGTGALVSAILGQVGRPPKERPLCLIPSFSFVATAAAAIQCGFEPHFIDVDENTWTVHPDCLNDHPMLYRTGLIIPVTSCGRQVDRAAWRSFQDTTGIPVIVDAAPSFDPVAQSGMPTSRVPTTVISLHATKTFSSGEGGLIIADPNVAARCQRASNFGFFQSRASEGPSTNAKLSEYQAAVGLAEHDEWPSKRAGFVEVGRLYNEAAFDFGLADQIISFSQAAVSYAFYKASSKAKAGQVIASLDAVGIATRRWYGNGLHRQPEYQHLNHDNLFVTESLCEKLVGLPIAVDLSRDEVRRIVSVIARGDRRPAAAQPRSFKHAHQ